MKILGNIKKYVKPIDIDIRDKPESKALVNLRKFIKNTFTTLFMLIFAFCVFSSRYSVSRFYYLNKTDTSSNAEKTTIFYLSSVVWINDAITFFISLFRYTNDNDWYVNYDFGAFKMLWYTIKSFWVVLLMDVPEHVCQVLFFIYVVPQTDSLVYTYLSIAGFLLPSILNSVYQLSIFKRFNDYLIDTYSTSETGNKPNNLVEPKGRIKSLLSTACFSLVYRVDFKK